MTIGLIVETPVAEAAGIVPATVGAVESVPVPVWKSDLYMALVA